MQEMLLEEVRLKESEIRDQIIEYLEKKGCMVWKDKQPTRKIRHNFSKSHGTPDILGILRDGTFLGIEVKTENGKIKDNQKKFIKKANQRYAVCFVARSLQDVIDYEKKEKIILC